MKVWKTLLLGAVAEIVLPISQPSQASTAIPMTISTGEGMFNLTVPDSDTTRSAYGGRLRVYDVHVAKMFEVTHWMCASGRLSPGTTWTYLADDGAVNMGDFRISCQLANDIAAAYGWANQKRLQCKSRMKKLDQREEPGAFQSSTSQVEKSIPG